MNEPHSLGRVQASGSSSVYTASPDNIHRIVEILRNHPQLKNDWPLVIREVTQRQHWADLDESSNRDNFSSWMLKTLDHWIADAKLNFSDLLKCIKKYNPSAAADLESKLLPTNRAFQDGNECATATVKNHDCDNDEPKNKRQKFYLLPQQWWPDKKELINSFVERKIENTLTVDKLKTIISNNENKKAVVAQKATVSGLGGIGKTTIAIRFAEKYGYEYDHIIWLDCGEQQLEMYFTKLAKDLNIDVRDGKDNLKSLHFLTSDIYFALRHFNCLLIFDNVDEYGSVFNVLPKEKLHHTLITSRNQCWGSDTDYGKIEMIQLDVFSVEDSELFLKQTVCMSVHSTQNGNCLNSATTEHNNDIAELGIELGYLPLALRIASATIIHLKWTIKEYIDAVTSNRNLLLQYDKGVDDYKMSLLKCLWVTIDIISKDAMSGRTGIDILNVFSFLTPDKIQKSFVVEIFVDKLKFDIDLGLTLLQNYSLISVSNNIEGEIYSIHRLLQEVVRFKMIDVIRRGVFSSILKLMDREHMRKYYQDNIWSVWDYAIKNDETVDEYWKFFTTVVERRKNRINRTASFSFLSDSLPQLLRVVNYTNGTYLRASDAIAHVLFDKQNYSEANKHWNNLFTILSKPPVMPEVKNVSQNNAKRRKYLVSAMLNVGVVMEKLGNLTYAADVYKQVANMEIVNRYPDVIEIVYGVTIHDTDIVVNPMEFEVLVPRVAELNCKCVSLHLKCGDDDKAWEEWEMCTMVDGKYNYELWKHSEHFFIVVGLKLLNSVVYSENWNKCLQLFQYLWEGLKLLKDVSSAITSSYWDEIYQYSTFVFDELNYLARFELAEVLQGIDKLNEAKITWTRTIDSLISVPDGSNFLPNIGVTRNQYILAAHYNRAVVNYKLGSFIESVEVLKNIILVYDNLFDGSHLIEFNVDGQLCTLTLKPMKLREELPSKIDLQLVVVNLLLRMNDVGQAWEQFEEIRKVYADNDLTWWKGHEEIIIFTALEFLQRSRESGNLTTESYGLFEYVWKGFTSTGKNMSSVNETFYWKQLVQFSAKVFDSPEKLFQFAAEVYNSGQVDRAGDIWGEIENQFCASFNAVVAKEKLGKFGEAAELLKLLLSNYASSELNLVNPMQGIEPIITDFELKIHVIKFDEFLPHTEIRCVLIVLLLKAEQLNEAVKEFQCLNLNSTIWWEGVGDIAIVVTIRLLHSFKNVDSQRDNIAKSEGILVDALKAAYSKSKKTVSITIGSIRKFMKNDENIPNRFWGFLGDVVREKLRRDYKNDLINYLCNFIKLYNRILGPTHALSWSATNLIASNKFEEENYDKYLVAWQDAIDSFGTIPIVATTDEMRRTRKWYSIAKFNLGVGMELVGKLREAVAAFNNVIYDSAGSNSAILIKFQGEELVCSISLNPISFGGDLPPKLPLQLMVLVNLIRLDDGIEAWKMWDEISASFEPNDCDWFEGYVCVVVVNGLKLLQYSCLLRNVNADFIPKVIKMLSFLCGDVLTYQFKNRLFYLTELISVADSIAILLQRKNDLRFIYSAVEKVAYDEVNTDKLKYFGLNVLRHLKCSNTDQDSELLHLISAIRTRLGLTDYQHCAVDETPQDGRLVETFDFIGVSELKLKIFDKLSFNLELLVITSVSMKFATFHKRDLVWELNKCRNLRSLLLERVRVTGQFSERAFLPHLTVFVIDFVDYVGFDLKKWNKILNDASVFYKSLEKKEWGINEVKSLDLDEIQISVKGNTRLDINREKRRFECSIYPGYKADEIAKSIDFTVETLVFKSCILSPASLTSDGLKLSFNCLKQLTLHYVTFHAAGESEIELTDSLLKFFPHLEEFDVLTTQKAISINVNKLPLQLKKLKLSHIKIITLSIGEDALRRQNLSLTQLTLNYVTLIAVGESGIELNDSMLKFFPHLEELVVLFDENAISISVNKLPLQLKKLKLSYIKLITISIEGDSLLTQYYSLTQLTLHCVTFPAAGESEIELTDSLLNHFPKLEKLGITVLRTPISLEINNLPLTLCHLRLDGTKLLYNSRSHETEKRNLSSQTAQLKTISLETVALPTDESEILQLFGTSQTVFIKGYSSGNKSTPRLLGKLVDIKSIQVIYIYNFDWSPYTSVSNTEFLEWLQQLGIKEDANGFRLDRIQSDFQSGQTANQLWRGKVIDYSEFNSQRDTTFKYTPNTSKFKIVT